MTRDAGHSKTNNSEPEVSGGDVDDDSDLPVVDEDTILTGAAADAVDLEEQLKSLPRIVRMALLINRRGADIHDRLISDIVTLSPGLRETAAFAEEGSTEAALTLAKTLDRLAVADDVPELRHIADCLRLISLPLQQDLHASEDYRRVTRTLLAALAQLPEDIDLRLGAEIETFIIGWSMLPALRHRLPRYRRPYQAAAAEASALGELTAVRRMQAAEDAIRTAVEAHVGRKADEGEAGDKITERVVEPPGPGEHQRIVATLSQTEMKNKRLKELLPPIAHVVNKAIPLVTPPPLAEVRNALLFEFPHAQNVIDTILGDLVGRSTIFLRPTLILGKCGGGKTLLARRIAESLRIFCWRTDCARADSAFAGTDRRWNSAEPCHPFLAIARANHANPLVLLDEIDKAGGGVSAYAVTASGHSEPVPSLWHCLLGMLEGESSQRYLDPLLQNFVDLSQICYLATANDVAGLPLPLLDRLRVVEMPLPSSHHLDALLPAVLADLARDRGLDARWVTPLDRDERGAIASAWHGGSVRRLRQLVEVIMRDRDANAPRN